jgi:hypothetical protein
VLVGMVALAGCAIVDCSNGESDQAADQRDSGVAPDGSAGASGGSGGTGAGGSSGTASAGGSAGAGGSVSGEDGGLGAGGLDAGGLDTGSPPGRGGSSGAGGSGGAAGADSGPPSCRDDPRFRNVLFCDNFEDPALPEWTVKPPPAGNAQDITRVATTRRWRGAASLHTRKVGAGDGSPLYADALGHLTTGHLYIRFYLYVTAPMPAAIPTLPDSIGVFVVGESADDLGGGAFNLWKDAVSFGFRGGANDGSIKDTGYVLPANTWHCVRVDFAIGNMSRPRIRIGGTTLPAVRVCPTERAAYCDSRMTVDYNRIWIGTNWSSFAPNPPAEFFYDDFVVDRSDIPCD